MADLKRCPFCGELPTTNVIVTQKGGGVDCIAFSVRCGKCRTEKSVTLVIRDNVATFSDAEKVMEEAANKWNMRWNQD